MKRLWTVTLAAAGCALAAGLALQVFAQQPAFPTKPIRMIFGFAPGGSGDLAARLLADVATRTLGQHVVMENRTGANGMIAAEAIAKSAPDGYSVLYCTTGNMTIITELPGTKLAVNPATELVGLSQMLRSTFGLVVGKDSPWKTTQGHHRCGARQAGHGELCEPGCRLGAASLG